MAANCPHCSKEVTGWIPEDRLSKMAADKREALAQLEALKTDTAVFKTKADSVDALTAELTEARAHAQSIATTHGRQLDVYRHGVTDSEDVADLLAIYERRAPEGTTLGDWLGNKEGLPRSVSALLGSAPVAPVPVEVLNAAPPATPAEVAPPNPVLNGAAPVAPAPVASANVGAVPTPPGRAMPSAADISSMSLDEYKAHRDTLLAGLT
ncbi:MAG TPA: hypothetical protein EYN66_00150 [Myxococcales bacterium]|nr:hypothetical protein [Myxococcales bacterium]